MKGANRIDAVSVLATIFEIGLLYAVLWVIAFMLLGFDAIPFAGGLVEASWVAISVALVYAKYFKPRSVKAVPTQKPTPATPKPRAKATEMWSNRRDL